MGRFVDALAPMKANDRVLGETAFRLPTYPGRHNGSAGAAS